MGAPTGRRAERAVLECFARYFGDEALGPLGYAETDWGAEVYSRGGYAGVPTPGLLLDHGPALQEPVGRIYWAGAETASEWSGYMDGAVESGERAAREVLSALAGEQEAPGYSLAATPGFFAAAVGFRSPNRIEGRVGQTILDDLA